MAKESSEPEAVEEEEQAPAWDGSLSSDEEIVSADGHVTLSKEDLKARK